MAYAAAGCTGSSKAPTLRNGGLNEDRFQISQLQIGDDTNALYVGVFDGHGGPGASSYLVEHFLANLRHTLSTANGVGLEEVLHENFLYSDRTLFMAVQSIGREYAHHREERCKCSFYRESPCRCLRAPRSAHEGSTATIILFTHNRVYCANVGDSEAVLVTRSGLVRSTNDGGCREYDVSGSRSAIQFEIPIEDRVEATSQTPTLGESSVDGEDMEVAQEPLVGLAQEIFINDEGGVGTTEADGNEDENFEGKSDNSVDCNETREDKEMVGDDSSMIAATSASADDSSGEAIDSGYGAENGGEKSGSLASRFASSASSISVEDGSDIRMQPSGVCTGSEAENSQFMVDVPPPKRMVREDLDGDRDENMVSFQSENPFDLSASQREDIELINSSPIPVDPPSPGSYEAESAIRSADSKPTERLLMDTSGLHFAVRSVEPGNLEGNISLKVETMTIADTPVPDLSSEDYIRVRQIAQSRTRRKPSKTRSGKNDGIRRGPTNRFNYVALEGAHSLNMTRAFGNFGHKVFTPDCSRIVEPQSPIIVRPHVNIFEPAEENDFLFFVVASDGLWDNLGKDEVTGIIRQYCRNSLTQMGDDLPSENEQLLAKLAEGSSETLLSRAISRNKKLDDITVVVVLFQSLLADLLNENP